MNFIAFILMIYKLKQPSKHINTHTLLGNKFVASLKLTIKHSFLSRVKNSKKIMIGLYAPL